MSARIVVRSLVNGIPVGGMSYAIDPNLKTPLQSYPEREIAGTVRKRLRTCLNAFACELTM
jgi:hypothetical protein